MQISHQEHVKSLFILQSKEQDCMIIKHGGHMFWEILVMCEGNYGLLFLDGAFQELIGWAADHMDEKHW